MAPHPPAFAAHRLGRKMIEFWTTADNIPAVPGAYVLVISFMSRSWPALAESHQHPSLRANICTVARPEGPTVLRGRLARHMRHGKSIHWHIDTLTESGTVLGAWTFPGGNECDLVDSLSHLPIAVEGFGSSDCSRCVSHLLRWARGARMPLFHHSAML